MNVLFVSNDPSIFNSDSVARARMRTYAQAIGTLHIISEAPVGTAPLTREELLEGHTLTLHAIIGKKPFIFSKITRVAKEIIADEKIEIVSSQDAFEYGKIAFDATRGTKAKFHIQMHTDAFSPWFTQGNITKISRMHMPMVYRLRQKIADKIVPHADGIRVVSQRIHDSLIARYGNTIVQPAIIPIAVPSVLPPAVPLPAHNFTFALITVGRLEPEKRIEDILYALAKIHARYPAVGLFIVGEGSERKKLEKLTKKLGLAQLVEFLGNRTDAIGLMQSAQVYVQASAYEGYSRTLVEAALARVPIIASDVGIVGEVFKGYEDILAVPPGDPAAIATHIIGLLEDNEARAQFAMNAEKRVREHLANVHTAPEDIAADLRRVIATHP